jgi:hypothetical protein
MRQRSNPHEPPSDYPPITLRALLVVAALVAAFPVTLFAIEHPTAVSASLLVAGAVAAAVSQE